MLITTLIAIPLAVGIVVGVTVVNHQARTSGLNLAAQGTSAIPGGMDMNQTPAQAANSLNCTLRVPANPLSAQGLATPYVLGDGCQMSNADLQAFVEADILNPRTGRITAYNPLVITQGTTPAAKPVPPRVPQGAVVAIMFGFNGNNLRLTSTGNSLQQGRCVNGLGQSLFSQVAYCNSPAFFRAARRAIASGQLKIPALGTASDGRACPTVRGFDVVDQDQSDNVVTTYLLTANGRTAQDSAANAAALGRATPINNGSDNALVNKFLDPALGCTPYQVNDRTAPRGVSGSQITDELFAAANQTRPVALVPLNDPMTMVGGKQSVAKTNLFRLGVGQPPVGAGQNADTPANYCKHMMQLGMARIRQNQARLRNFASPVPATGNNLFTFLAARLSGSFDNLGCGALLNAPNPVHLTTDANGVATGARFSKLATGSLSGGVAPSATPKAPASLTGSPSGTPTGTATHKATATATPTATATASASAAASAPAASTATPTP